MNTLTRLIPKVMEDILHREKDEKVRDEWACGCITCVRCPHKFDFPDCRNGLFDELYKEVSDGQQ